MDTVYNITVNEDPIFVKDSVDEAWKTVPEFNITVKASQYTIHVIRYIPDLESFDQLVKTHYQKIKIPFPTLSEHLSKAEKRRSIRNFFHMPAKKSNAEKVEKYLLRCAMDPVLKSSTLLRDFFSPQREGDNRASHDVSSDDLGPASTRNDDTMIDEKEHIVWVPSPHPSILSLPLSSVKSISSHSLKIYSSDRHSTTSILSAGSYQQSQVQSSHSEEEEDDDDQDIIQFMNDQQHSEYQFPLDNLEMVKVLGKGCMGKVLLVRSRTTRELYALKSIIKEHVIEQREITHTLDERNILTKLSEINHPYLAKLHTTFQDEHRLYLVTNYYSGGDLATHMAKLYSFPKEVALFYAAEIIDGIGELHRLGILYRDLKPENILLTGDGHIILTDFGLSKWLDEQDNYHTQTFCGTAEYLAPEVLLGEAYSFGIDYWSFSTILYEMLAGITPFWADNHADMYRRVLEDPLEFPADIFDYETAEFISDILDRDPKTRLGAQGVQEIKDHVYFADINWDDIRNRTLQPPYLPPSTSVHEEGYDDLDFTNFDPEFLAMVPQLTPISSEINLSSQLQDIFDGYSFTDETYQELEEGQRHYSRQANRQDGFYVDEQEQQEETEDDEIVQGPPLFQPARKRGSISMLSYHPPLDNYLDDDVLIKPSFACQDEEERYAKRRNTSNSDNHQSTTANALVVIPFDNDLEEFSKLPDLRLSFHMDREEQKQAPSKSSSHKSKTRRFFSLLL